jgi:hypothetical protein
MRPLILAVSLICAITVASQEKEKPAAHADREKLAAFLGHWESTGRFLDTKISKAKSVTSQTDCAWSPQGQSLMCDQIITDAEGEHYQLTVYQPNQNDANFTYITLNPGQKPFTGVLSINGDLWTYTGPPGSAGKYPEIKTVNTVKDGEETFIVQFTEDGKNWTTMIDGSMHRTNK